MPNSTDVARPLQTEVGLALETHQLTKRVRTADGEISILSDVSLRIGECETVAITGPSGSGKTSLLGLLAGLDQPTSGVVKLMGVDLTGLDEDGRARLRAQHVGFVFQSFQLLPHLTALENVMLGMELFGHKDARERASQMLETVGLGARLHHSPKTLSGGEQQRVALARAFVIRPKILFADEPTGSLDAKTGGDVSTLMFELNREHGSTLVMVTHDPEMAARCSRCIALHGGRVLS